MRRSSEETYSTSFISDYSTEHLTRHLDWIQFANNPSVHLFYLTWSSRREEWDSTFYSTHLFSQSLHSSYLSSAWGFFKVSARLFALNLDFVGYYRSRPAAHSSLLLWVELRHKAEDFFLANTISAESLQTFWSSEIKQNQTLRQFPRTKHFLTSNCYHGTKQSSHSNRPVVIITQNCFPPVCLLLVCFVQLLCIFSKRQRSLIVLRKWSLSNKKQLFFSC